MGEEFRPELEGEVREYNAEEGEKAVFSRIKELLASQDYVLVAFDLSYGSDVGKSTISSGLWERCYRERIPAIVFVDFTDLSVLIEPYRENLSGLRKEFHSKKGVIIMQAGGEGPPMKLKKEDRKFIREIQDNAFASEFKKVDLPIKKVDIWVSIYRPDHPFFIDEEHGYLGDIVIRNDKAVDKHPKK